MALIRRLRLGTRAGAHLPRTMARFHTPEFEARSPNVPHSGYTVSIPQSDKLNWLDDSVKWGIVEVGVVAAATEPPTASAGLAAGLRREGVNLCAF